MHAYAFRQSRKRLPQKKVTSFPPFPLVHPIRRKVVRFWVQEPVNPSPWHFADGLEDKVLTRPLLDIRFQRRHSITLIRDFKTRPKLETCFSSDACLLRFEAE